MRTYEVENLIVTADDYQKLAIRTKKELEPSNIIGRYELDLIHASLGLSSEAGEFADAIKKNIIYGKDLNVENAIEEIGDILWYCALACHTLGTTMHTVMHENIAKLKKRYPEKYSDSDAVERKDKVWFIVNSINEEKVCGPFENEYKAAKFAEQCGYPSDYYSIIEEDRI